MSALTGFSSTINLEQINRIRQNDEVVAHVFAWRNEKPELVAYLTELTQTDMVEYYRPNFYAGIKPSVMGYPALGIFGYLLSVVIGLWVVWDVVRYGRHRCGRHHAHGRWIRLR